VQTSVSVVSSFLANVGLRYATTTSIFLTTIQALQLTATHIVLPQSWFSTHAYGQIYPSA